ncbi:MAG: magnesium transporter CorA family protein [Verrucomicrobia bacterium]|nr:magnesium transporter CorA family protein [Verrucomicrobiota bacterium]
MLEIYFKTVRDLEFKRIPEFRTGSWIYIKEATLDDLSKIVAITGLDIADIRDSLDKYELPRIEHIGESIVFFVRHPGEVELGLYTETLTMIVTNNAVVAISPHRSEIVEQLIASNTTLGTTQKAKLILHILLKITQDYTNSIKRVRHSILEPRKGQIVDSNVIIALMRNEEILNQYLTALVPMRNLLESMAAGRYVNLYEKDIGLLDDLMIAIRQSEDVCRVNIKSIRSLRDSYQIIFTNDVNRTIKLLTALTVIVTIPTIVASIYGMNVALPFQNKPYAFLFVLGVTLVLTIVAILLFLRKRWL